MTFRDGSKGIKAKRGRGSQMGGIPNSPPALSLRVTLEEPALPSLPTVSSAFLDDPKDKKKPQKTKKTQDNSGLRMGLIINGAKKN